ncbi:hypothetical protein PC128_g23649 [Phytophthora cactorum]|nr:hypothetical protein PC120_g21243 [Phytophthora cactorum]KAG3047432.1 hypothetical protein PC121_g20061 [Phytophthora cactorum]KAG3148221.1 hypothetical protein PC128_g23649 [Phytophthora cactorum]KAG4043420.1 hypothetical protein PC123_g21108 [Phytophthora cactorum]
MVTLFCAIVGEVGNVFGVEINDVKALFLAKKDSEAASRSENVKNLKNGEKTALIEVLTHEDEELQGEDGVANVLEGMDLPSTGQIHVLVVVPVELPTPYEPRDSQLVVDGVNIHVTKNMALNPPALVAFWKTFLAVPT